MRSPSLLASLRPLSFAWLFCLLGAAPLQAQTAPPTIVGSATVTHLSLTDVDGMVIDRVALIGAAATITPAPGHLVRVLYIDPNDDIVMVDLTAGTFTFNFAAFSAPALPTKYVASSALIPAMIKGAPSLTVSSSSSSTRVRIAAMGRSNYPDTTIYRAGETYDGMADLERFLIPSLPGQQFGEFDAGNARFSASSGIVGISASTTTFAGAVSVGEIAASNSGVPSLTCAGASEVRLLGGSLFQPNGGSVNVSGFSLLKLLAGTDAHGVARPAANLLGQLRVASSPAAPVGASPSTTTFFAFLSGSFTVPGFGTPAPTFTLASGSTLPSWATLNATTGVISGLPSNSGGSPFSFNVQVSNGVGSAVTVAVTLVVNGPPPPPTVAAAPQSQAVAGDGTVGLSVSANGSNLAYRWQRNGFEVAGKTSAGLMLLAQPSITGFYDVLVYNGGGSVLSSPAVVGLTTAAKVLGTGTEIGSNVLHPIGNFYDQVLLQGAAASITADAGQATRLSFIDLSNDIVQVEFSGHGTLSLVLDGSSGPAAPTSYNQPTVSYMKGHAGIVIADADETTNVSVFSVGRATAFDPTGGFNFLLPISATNSPANNGSSLFQGQGQTPYDGYADIAYLAILSRNGKFGGVRTANTSYFARAGYTGVYAPGVDFTGPVFVHDIVASEDATPVLMTGTVSDARITGGSLKQTNSRAVQIGGINQLKFTAGSSSHGTTLPAQTNQGRLERNGTDVTASVVVNP